MPNQKLTLSLVIPVYNEEDHLTLSLAAIAAQSVKPLEVIVVDNGSTDRSIEIAQSYSFVTVIREPKRGIAYARNAGFNAARGNIIGRIDADSIIPPNWVADALNFMANHENTLLTGGSYVYDLLLPRFFGWIQGQLSFRVNRFIMGYYIAWGSNMAFPRASWLKVRGLVHLDSNIHEDMDLGMHLHEIGQTITYHSYWKVGIDSRSNSRHKQSLYIKWLKMWPATLEKHHLRRAWMGWVGVYLVYAIVSPMLWINWRLSRDKHL